MQAEHVRLGDHVVELGEFDAELAGPFLGDEGVVADHPHLEAPGALGDQGTDVADADQAHHLARQFGADEALAIPVALAQLVVRLGNAAGRGHHQRDRVLGGGDGVAAGGVHHDDAGGGGRLEVDVVHADPGAADHLEAVVAFKQVAADRGAATDNDTVDVGELLLEGIVVQFRLDQYLEIVVLLENIQAGLAQGVADQYAKSGHAPAPAMG